MQNLWADFDNDLLALEPDGRARKQALPSHRRPSEQAVVSSLRAWLLHDYTAAYCRSLAATRIFRRCYWIDALGSTRHTNILQPIAALSQALAQESKPITLHGILLEAGSSNRKEGRVTNEGNKRKPFSIAKETAIIRANWPEIAPIVLQDIDQSAAIFLLNPFGHAIFSYDDLAPLYARTAPTELCLLISHKQVETRLLPSLHTSTGASAFTALLHSDRWKKLLTNADSEEVARTIDGLSDELITAMRQQHFLSVQCIALPMQVRPAVVERAAYTLIFATRRQDSLIHMNDAVCVYGRRLDEQSHRGVLMEDWFTTQQQERFDEQFRLLFQQTLRQGKALRARHWPDLRQQLLIANFGQFTLYDYDEVIYKLLQSGEVRCEWRQRAPEHAGSAERRIPGNDDLLLWK